MSLRSSENLPPSPVVHASGETGELLSAGQPSFRSYQVDGYRIFEAARLSGASRAEAWASVQKFPEIWSRLGTTGETRRIEKARKDGPDIDVGTILRADALVFGIRLPMVNVVTTVVAETMFHLSVRALGGRFESEVEAAIEPWPRGTLLVWRQGYPEKRLFSWLTSRVLGSREADETRRILDLWAAELPRLTA